MSMKAGGNRSKPGGGNTAGAAASGAGGSGGGRHNLGRSVRFLLNVKLAQFNKSLCVNMVELPYSNRHIYNAESYDGWHLR